MTGGGEAKVAVAVAFMDSCCCGIGRFDGLVDRALRGEGVMAPWGSSAESLDVSGCVAVDLITVSLFFEDPELL